MQLQLRERFCAREYANSSFVWAVDWPLRCTPGGEGRGSSGLGRLCLAWRPSQASFSYTITVSSVGRKKTRFFCQLPLRASACTSKGYKERDASSISMLKRRKLQQRCSLIVIYDLFYIYMSWAPIHWRLVVILDLRDYGNIRRVEAIWGNWSHCITSNAVFCLSAVPKEKESLTSR